MMDWKTWWQQARGRWVSMRRPHALFLTDEGAIEAGADEAGADEAGADEAGTGAVAAFGQWCAAHPGAVCRVGLSCRWLLFSVAAPELSSEAARELAAHQWAHYRDMAPAELDRDWVLRETLVPGARLLCAAPRALIDGLLAHARTHRVQLIWLGPWWAHAVQAWLDQQPTARADGGQPLVLQLSEPGLLTHARLKPDELGAMRLEAVWVEWGAPDVPRPGPVLTMPEPLPAMEGAPRPASAEAAPLPSPRTWQSRVWAHEAVMPILRGAASAWQGSA